MKYPTDTRLDDRNKFQMFGDSRMHSIDISYGKIEDIQDPWRSIITTLLESNARHADEPIKKWRLIKKWVEANDVCIYREGQAELVLWKNQCCAHRACLMKDLYGHLQWKRFGERRLIALFFTMFGILTISPYLLILSSDFPYKSTL